MAPTPLSLKTWGGGGGWGVSRARPPPRGRDGVVWTTTMTGAVPGRPLPQAHPPVPEGTGHVPGGPPVALAFHLGVRDVPWT